MIAVYQWSSRDKIVYYLILLPFIIGFVMATYLLAAVSIYLAAAYLLLYLIVNLIQAGCCIGCPYRGKWCPTAYGIYLANIISSKFFKQTKVSHRTAEMLNTVASILAIITMFFPLYWLVQLNWIYALVYFVLMLSHNLFFFPIICPKCSYNKECPGGRMICSLLRL